MRLWKGKKWIWAKEGKKNEKWNKYVKVWCLYDMYAFSVVSCLWLRMPLSIVLRCYLRMVVPCVVLVCFDLMPGLYALVAVFCNVMCYVHVWMNAQQVSWVKGSEPWALSSLYWSASIGFKLWLNSQQLRLHMTQHQLNARAHNSEILMPLAIGLDLHFLMVCEGPLTLHLGRFSLPRGSFEMDLSQ